MSKPLFWLCPGTITVSDTSDDHDWTTKIKSRMRSNEIKKNGNGKQMNN